MRFSVLALAAIFAHQATASAIPQAEVVPAKAKRASCDNTATSRDCWGDYDLSTNYYTTWPDTGVTREYWLEITNITVAPDGISREAVTFNGTIPGPTISADWGDNLVIHVTNKLENNGTTVHWHGIRQLGTPESDGVPGVTQCPIAPGESMTYSWQATQYGSSWYHSHFTLQLGDGMAGPIVINGPASADYDEDLGLMFLSDWFHSPASTHWPTGGGPPTPQNGLINGTNIYNNSGVVTGSRWETVFESGTKYRLRLLNAAIEGYFRFALDGHDFQVIANDLVPIVPYTTDNLVIAIGERYDIIITANATSGDYWLRAIWETACDTNDATNGIMGIVRYDSNSTADPTTTVGDYPNVCEDAPYDSLVPYLSLTVGADSEEISVEDTVSFTGAYEMWSINGTSLKVNWSEPTFMDVYNNKTDYAASDNVELLTATDNEWIYWILVDDSGIAGLNHPIHLHGHDFFILSQSSDTFDPTTSPSSFNLNNPPRRDTATLPAGGYLALAWQADNPGAWLIHCHIGWHASEGFATQFMERRSEIAATFTDYPAMEDMCTSWDDYYPTSIYKQDDSGI